MKNIAKSFSGTIVLKGVNLELGHGEILALLGENGAGKSTLMKILSGIYSKDSGEIYLDGELCDFQNPKEAQNKGVAIIHQEMNLCNDLSVSENIFLGREVMEGLSLNHKKMDEEAQKILDDLGISMKSTELAGDLKVSEQQMVEIAKALSQDAKVLIMDEPTSSITQSEVENLFKKIEELKKNGVSIVYISHKMDEVFRIADDISILRDGKVVASKKASEFDLESVISLMVGRKIENAYPKEDVELGDKVLEVEHLSKDKLFENVDFHVKKGEIVGFAGLVGAGRTEVMRAVYGLDHKDGGSVKIKSKEVNIKNPADSIKEGLILLSESRKDDGIVPVRSVMENASLASLQKFIYSGFTHRKKERNAVYESFMKMNVKTPTLDTPISSLSGGNQQKVLLSRWMLSEPDILILDEPTRGIDIGAKFEIYKLMTDMVKEGKAIIMVSSELPELIGMCDRIYVMNKGHISGMLNRDEFSQEDIMRYATGL